MRSGIEKVEDLTSELGGKIIDQTEEVSFGKDLEDSVLHLKKSARLRDRDTRYSRGHVEDHAFVELRHEFRAQALKGGNCQDD